MRFGFIALATVLTVNTSQLRAGAGDFAESVTTASRELARQLEYLQRAFVTIPGPPEGRGLFQQTQNILYDLIAFRQRLKAQASREDLAIAFDKVDGGINTLLADIQPFESWVPAVRMVARAVKSAQHDVQFALYDGSGTPARQTDTMYRQTLVLQFRAEDLEGMVRYVFDEDAAQKRWLGDFADLRRSITQFQKAQKSKASADELQGLFKQTDQVWEKLVGNFKELPEGQHLMLRLDYGREDQVMARIARLLGIQNRRPPLRADFI